MNKKTNLENSIRKMIESLAEVVSEDQNLTDQYLISTGNNPKDIESSGEAFIKRIKGQIRLKIAKEQHAKFIELKKLFVFQGNKLINEAKERLAEALSSGNTAAFQTYYRKLDKLTEHDCNEINNEQAFLEFLEKLEE
ncbi:MAG: hypothetical protein GYA14_07090 [Ignavibacteria bacterium]|nr:hypothetical protein [Ignavibacteria bacterium]